MAIVNKFTATLPNPSATHVDGFVFLLSTQWFIDAANASGATGSPIDGGAKSLANGGGDIQAFADDATTEQLPLHVATFVTGGSPDAEVWLRRPTWTAGDVITIAKDSAQTVQPLPGSIYGYHNVYQDYVAVNHGAGLENLTGNADFTVVGTTPTQKDIFLGKGHVFNGSNALKATLPSTISHPATCTLQMWHRANNDTGVESTAEQAGISLAQTVGVGGRDFSLIPRQSGTPSFFMRGFCPDQAKLTSVTSALAMDKPAYSTYVVDNAANLAITARTADDGVSSVDTPITPATDYVLDGVVLGGRGDASPNYYAGVIAESRVSLNVISSAKEQDEYSNLSDPDNFAAIGPWVDAGAPPTTTKPWWLFQEED